MENKFKTKCTIQTVYKIQNKSAGTCYDISYDTDSGLIEISAKSFGSLSFDVEEAQLIHEALGKLLGI